MILFRLVTLSSFIFLAMPQFAYAYLDPSSISYLIQLGVASLAGGLYLVKIYWGKMIFFFKTAFGFLRSREKHDDRK